MVKIAGKKGAAGFLLTDRKSGAAEPRLSDYPLSLRQSAQAVYGSIYTHAEKQVDIDDVPEDASFSPV
jgi:hypothetical protein